MGKLTANDVKSCLAKGTGLYQDGDGLFLRVTGVGVGQWKLRIQHDGKRRDIGLGSSKLVSLAAARAKAAEARKAIREDGRDLIAERREAKAATTTFREAALALHEAHKHQWANAKHSAQWLATLKTYAFPSLGSKPVGAIAAGDIIAAISGVWTTKPETGRRVRQRICAVLDYAHARGWRATEAPARALSAGKGLPKQPGGKHHSAMAYAEVSTFLTRLRASGGVWGRLALEFVIFTAARSQEVRLATWDEVDGRWPVDHPRRAYEDEARAYRAAFAASASGAAKRLGGADQGHRAHLPRHKRQPHVGHDPARGAAPDGRAGNGARLPLLVSHLGRRGNRFSGRGSRGSAGASEQQRGRARLSARGASGKTAQADGHLGCLL